MSGQWKPGDACVADWMGCQIRGFIDTDGRFYTTDQRAVGVSASKFALSDLRPLVVIDPEDREQVERFARIASTSVPFDFLTPSAQADLLDRVQAALREFANPTPPRIGEPGVWGVVKASCVHADEVRTWMRHEDDNWYVVGTDTKNNPDDWDSLIDPVLVREGVTP